jgi:hypothetical protein
MKFKPLTPLNPCEQILSGKGEAKPYRSFLGHDGLSCTYKSVTIAYDPGKIKKK